MDNPHTIYLDHAATTPLHEGALAAMLPFLADPCLQANPSASRHGPGQRAGEAIDCARRQVAGLIGANPGEIVFTSGATEANNHALRGLAGGVPLIVTGATEHASVLETARALAAAGGVEHHTVAPSETGQVTAEAVAQALAGVPGPALVSVMMANNETGLLNPVAAIGRVARDAGAFFHVDATQAVGKVPVAVAALGADLVSFSAHKFYGPKGIGALWLGSRVREIAPLMTGGDQQGGIRAGTLPTHQIVGMGAAAALAREELDQRREHVEALASLLLFELRADLPDLVLHGEGSRVPGVFNCAFPGCDAQALMAQLPDVAVSSGSACHTGSVEPSHVLTAMGVSADLARGSLRFSLGRHNSREAVLTAAQRIAEAVERTSAAAGGGVAMDLAF